MLQLHTRIVDHINGILKLNYVREGVMIFCLLVVFVSSSAVGMEMKLTKIQERIINNDIIIPYIFTDYSYIYQYPLDHIRLRYQEDYGANDGEARIVEFEFKSLMIKTHLNHPIPETPLKRQIRNFWQLYILHTKDYYAFCLKCFGKIIHHTPTVFDNLNLEERKIERARSYSSPSKLRDTGDKNDSNH